MIDILWAKAEVGEGLIHLGMAFARSILISRMEKRANTLENRFLELNELSFVKNFLIVFHFLHEINHHKSRARNSTRRYVGPSIEPLHLLANFEVN